MKIPYGVIGFGLFVIGSAIFGQIRGSRLRQASEKVMIDSSKETVLRYEIWIYILPILMLGLGAFIVFVGENESIPVRHKMAVIFGLILILGGIFLFYRFGTGRIKIFENKLIYKEGGDCWEVRADDVLQYRFNGLSFFVKKKSKRTTRIPATFQHSEIIFAFLKQAAVNKMD
jgi:hypothetical protein